MFYEVGCLEGLMHGLYLLWWVQEKQISAALVATILAAGDLALMVVEIPTGWFADRFGHRASLLTGSFLQVLGMLCCWLGRGIPGLIAASVLVALGDGFRSGADQALLYRTCVALDREDAFQRYEARTRAVQQGALVGLVLAGGAIVKTWGFAAGWATETALCAMGFAIACAMVEPLGDVGHADKDRDDRNDVRVSRKETVASSADPRAILGRRMALLILPAAFLGGAASAASFLAQTAGSGDPAHVATLVAMIALAEAVGSACAMGVPGIGFQGQAIFAAAGLVVIGAALVFPSAFLSVVIVLAFLIGVAHPLRAAAIQRLAADSVRARAASVASACDMAFTIVALPLAGWWRRTR